MKNLNSQAMELIKGGDCQLFPGNTDNSVFGNGCFNTCLLAASMSQSPNPFACTL